MDRTCTVAGFPLLVLALLALEVSAASATTPDPRYSTCDQVVVGNSSGVAIGGTRAGFDASIRDFNNAPVPGRTVTLAFANSAVRLYAVQNPGTTLDCAARTLSRVTNQQGLVNFAPRMGGYDNANTIQVLDDGTQFATVKARSTDLDGLDGGSGLNDLLLFSANYFGNQAAQETDFDLNGSTGLGDYLIFAAEYLAPGANSYCP